MLRLLALLVVVAVTSTACTDADGARKALIGAGYSDIQIGEYAAFGCGRGDDYATKFTAKGPTGVVVTGVVCSGVLKGSTIRTF